MKSLYIAIKNLKDTLRDIKSEGIVFILPIVFIGVFGLAFNDSFSNLGFDVAVVSSNDEMYQSLIAQLSELKTETDTGEENKLFFVEEFEDRDLALQSVQDGDNTILVEEVDGRFNVIYDQTNNFAAAGYSTIKDVVNQDTGMVTSEGITTKNFTGFEELAPGLIVYGLLILIPQTAFKLSELREKNYIFRYFTSKASSFDIILGTVLSQTIVAIIQSVVLFATAVVFGLDISGSLILAFFVTFIANFFSIAIGLIIAGITSKTDAAQNIGTILSIILGFFSGSFIANANEVEIFGFSFSELLPSFYATEALKSILLFGNDITEVTTEILILTISSIALIALGVVIFNRNQLRRV